MSGLQPSAAQTEPSHDDIVLEVRNLRVAYATTTGRVQAVNDVSFSLQAGRRLAIIGESGSGKTTLATALLRLSRPPAVILGGAVLLKGRDLMLLDDVALRMVRLRDIALVPQGSMNSLNPVMRIADQIQDGITAHEPRWPRGALRTRVVELLASVGLDPSVADRYPHQLSGGMKQRVVMAIASSLSPSVLLADEPTSALDVVVQRQVLQTLGDLQARLGAAVILIGHDMGLVAQFADDVGVMYAGRIVELGPVADVIAEPKHPYTKLLVESLPTLDVKRTSRGIPGLPPALTELSAGCAFAPRCPWVMSECTLTRPELTDRAFGHAAACHIYDSYSSLPVRPANGAPDPIQVGERAS